jgi:ubiquinone/menaquinone biosynthesis C-methylase UbiE
MNEYYETRYTFDRGRTKVWKAITEYLQENIRTDSDTVLDLGAGYCDFINNIKACKKIAIDINPETIQFCNSEVKFYCASVDNISALDENSVDVLFASNLLEHLDDAELAATLKEISRVVKKGAKIILIQPNYRYSYKEYFDDYTHKKIFTHISLKDYFQANGFEALKVYPKFLPFSLKSRLPKSYMLTKIYLLSFWKPMAKQMLLIFRKV